jgi:hypothetical protein
VDGKFSPDQAIIVRNEEIRKTVPKWMIDMRGLIMTIEECKGREFNDVIVFDFFDQKLANKWKIFKYLDIYPQRGDKAFSLREIDVN